MTCNKSLTLERLEGVSICVIFVTPNALYTHIRNKECDICHQFEVKFLCIYPRKQASLLEIHLLIHYPPLIAC